MIFYALLILFVFEWVRPGNFIPGVDLLRLNSFVPLGVILATMISKGKYSNEEILKESNTKAILFLVALIVGSFAIAEVTMYSVQAFTIVFGYALLYYVIAKQVTGWREIKGVFATLVFVHLVLAALTPQMLLDPNTRHYMASGTFVGDGNDYALSVCISIPMCLFLMLDARTKYGMFLAGISLLILTLCVIATQSRGGTLALGCVALYYWWKSKRKVLTGGVAVAGLCAVLVFAPPAYFQRMNTISAYQTDGSAQGRLQAWKAGIGMMLSNPVMGVGAGQFPANFTRYAPADENSLTNANAWKTAHSIYFLILGELGLPGLGVLFYFIFSNLAKNQRLLRQLASQRTPHQSRHAQLLSSLSVCVIAYAVAGAFLSATYYPHMFVLSGLLVSARRLVHEESLAQPAAVGETVPQALPAAAPLSKLVPGPLLGRHAATKPAMTERELVPPHGRFF